MMTIVVEFQTNCRQISYDKVVEFQTNMFVAKPTRRKVENSTTLQDNKKNLERTLLFIIAIRHNRTLRRMSSDFALKCCCEAVPRGFVNAI